MIPKRQNFFLEGRPLYLASSSDTIRWLYILSTDPKMQPAISEISGEIENEAALKIDTNKDMLLSILTWS